MADPMSAPPSILNSLKPLLLAGFDDQDKTKAQNSTPPKGPPYQSNRELPKRMHMGYLFGLWGG
jgi:hypothetical protein